jgi:triosephosphate isomerase
MQRKPLVIGNWKMHGSQSFTTDFVQALSVDSGPTEVALAVPYPYLSQLQGLIAQSAIAVAAQTVSAHAEGAYTGEVSAPMLREFGCQYVLVGHSERRCYHGETDADVAGQFAAAMQAGMQPVLCVGESLSARESGDAISVIMAQCEAVWETTELVGEFVMAYEPVWAIGTGKVPTVAEVQAVHAAIRDGLEKVHNEIAKRTRILYGGSVKPSNCGDLFAAADVDGGLIGGASLQPAVFSEVIEICNKSCLSYM